MKIRTKVFNGTLYVIKVKYILKNDQKEYVFIGSVKILWKQASYQNNYPI